MLDRPEFLDMRPACKWVRTLQRPRLEVRIVEGLEENDLGNSRYYVLVIKKLRLGMRLLHRYR